MAEESLRRRDGGLINNWYIACTSEELQKTPISRTIYEVPFVLFRDEYGKAACFADRCIHRAGQLSKGTCVDGKLQCPYHGWTYSSKGCVVGIPSEGKTSKDPDEPLRPNLKTRSLPCVERDGVVWIWRGDAEPTTPEPVWNFPMSSDPKWDSYFMITDFDNEVTNLVENFMDVPHTVFVHKGWFRTPSRKRVPIDIDVKDGSVLVTYDQPNDSIGFTGRLINPSGEKMKHTDQFIYPNITRVDYHFGAKSGFIVNSQCTPVREMKTRVFTYIAFQVGRMTPLLGHFMRFYTRRVIEQDVVIMKNQGDNLQAHAPEKFKSTDADEIHLAVEKLRDMGVEGNSELRNWTKSSRREFWI